MKRRTFLKGGLAGAALFAVPRFVSGQQTTDNGQQSMEYGQGTTDYRLWTTEYGEGSVDSSPLSVVGCPLTAPVLGMAGYTFNKFDIDTTLAFMKRIDVHYLCIKDFHLPLDADAERIAEFKAKLRAHDVVGYGVGPIYMKDVEAVDRAFAYAQRVGVDLVVGVPGVWGDKAPRYEVLDRVEQKVKETGIRYAIHLHGPDMALYPDATSVWNDVCERDERMGMCLDIGHNLRAGADPIRDLKRYRKRVFDIHIKDVTLPTKAGKAIELGRGIIDFRAFVKMLRRVDYKGSLSLEYEKDMTDPFVGIAESIGYFRGVQSTV